MEIQAALRNYAFSGFPIVADSNRLVGFITRQDLENGLAQSTAKHHNGDAGIQAPNGGTAKKTKLDLRRLWLWVGEGLDVNQVMPCSIMHVLKRHHNVTWIMGTPSHWLAFFVWSSYRVACIIPLVPPVTRTIPYSSQRKLHSPIRLVGVFLVSSNCP